MRNKSLPDKRRPKRTAEDNGVFIEHPGLALDPVMREVLAAYPEETFCFLNIGKLRERIGLFRDHFLPDDPSRAIAYAVKANPKRKILEILTEEGIKHFDCASRGEIDTVTSVNPEAQVLFNHPVKTQKDISYASRKGVSHFTVQSSREIEKIGANAVAAPGAGAVEIAVRMRMMNDHAKLNLSTKFGADEESVQNMIREIREMAGFLPGISTHTGSQNVNSGAFSESIGKMARIAKKNGKVKTFNVGGGLPANYFPEDRYDVRSYLEEISRSIRENALDALLDEPKIIIEPGRAIIAEAVDLVIPVLSVQTRNGIRNVYFNDGVWNSFGDGPINGWKYNFVPFSIDAKAFSPSEGSSILFGQTCCCGDNLGEVSLPGNIAEGDYIHVPAAGAYMDCLFSSFSSLCAPKYVTYNPTS